LSVVPKARDDDGPMLTALRSWLSDLIRPAVPERAAAPAALPAQSGPSPAAKRAPEEEDAERRAARLERRRREAEEQAKRAEERSRVADAARKAAEERARALDLELAQTRERARSAEARAKKAAAERPRKGARGRAGGGSGPDSDERLRASEGRARALRDRAEDAERRAAEAEARLEAEQRRTRELEASLAEAENRRAEPAPAPRAAPMRRDASRSALDVHFSPGDECLFAICRQIESAERSADVCVFTITDDRIATRLLDAHRRGVRVRIITDNDKAFDEGSDVHRLGRAGIEVRVDRTPFHMHHKFAVFDERRMLTGSYNWTRGAARDNQENVIVSDDPRLLRPFGREFVTLWEKLGRG
jgi:cardiolipin hydrolase